MDGTLLGSGIAMVHLPRSPVCEDLQSADHENRRSTEEQRSAEKCRSAEERRSAEEPDGFLPAVVPVCVQPVY